MAHDLRLFAAAAIVAALSTVVMAQTFSALRGSTPLGQEGPPPPITPEQNTSVRRAQELSGAASGDPTHDGRL